MREKLIQQLEKFEPFNPQEQMDKSLILKLLNEVEDVFYRENRVNHITVSGWVLNKDFSKVLMCYHNIYNSYSWLGGHADGDEDLLAVAIREVKEESGIQNVRPYMEDIFSIESLTVDGHEKRGQYVSSHLHINITYLLIADEQEQLIVNEAENSDVKWFGIDEAIEASNEEWFKKRIYSKLNDKLRAMKIVREG